MNRQWMTALMLAACVSTPALAQNDADPNRAAPAPAAAAPDAAAPADLPTVQNKASYVIGRSIGSNIRSQGLDLDLTSLMTGLKEAIADQPSRLSEEAIDAAMEAFQKEMQAKMAAKAEAGKKVGLDFLAANKKKEGVQSTPTGLQYKVITAGTGAKPKATDTVTVHYRGTLIDGVEFDSSHKRNAPATFPLNGVISGWTEALQMMPVGSKWTLYIPSDLAYGDEGSGPIPPHSTLIFEVELLEIKAPQPKQ